MAALRLERSCWRKSELADGIAYYITIDALRHVKQGEECRKGRGEMRDLHLRDSRSDTSMSGTWKKEELTRRSSCLSRRGFLRTMKVVVIAMSGSTLHSSRFAGGKVPD